jgi:hypothetical protein
VTDTVRAMRRGLAGRCLLTSAFRSYSGCRQYQDIVRALDAVPGAPEIDRSGV